MNRKGFAPIVILLIIAGILAAGITGYLYSHRPLKTPNQTSPPSSIVTTTTVAQTATSSAISVAQPILITPSSTFNFSCGSTTDTATYENPTMGIAFCYPSDLTVTTGSISWPQTYRDYYGKDVHPYLNFNIRHTAMPIIPQLSIYGCAADGPNGSDRCINPEAAQMIRGANQNNLNYVFYRTTYINEKGGTVSILSSSTGPYAYFPFANNYFLVFYTKAPASLPAYVDNDLKSILDTVAIAPQTYITAINDGLTEDTSTRRVSSITLIARASGNISLNADLNGIENLPGVTSFGDNLNQRIDIDPTKIDFNKLKIVIDGNPGTSFTLDLTYTTNHRPYTDDPGIMNVSSQEGGSISESYKNVYEAYFSSDTPAIKQVDVSTLGPIQSPSTSTTNATTTALPPPVLVTVTLSNGSTTTVPQSVQQSFNSTAGAVMGILSRCIKESSTTASSTIYIVVDSTGYEGTATYFDGNGKNIGAYSGGDVGPEPPKPVDISNYSCVPLERQ